MTTKPPIATRAVALATASKAAATKTTKINTCHCGRSCWLLAHQGMQMVIPAKMIRAIELKAPRIVVRTKLRACEVSCIWHLRCYFEVLEKKQFRCGEGTAAPWTIATPSTATISFCPLEASEFAEAVALPTYDIDSESPHSRRQVHPSCNRQP